MSKRIYPRIGSIQARKYPAPCKGKDCAAKADCRVEIQVNWFRGDDEVVNLCGVCFAKARNGQWDHIFYQTGPEAA